MCSCSIAHLRLPANIAPMKVDRTVEKVDMEEIEEMLVMLATLWLTTSGATTEARGMAGMAVMVDMAAMAETVGLTTTTMEEMEVLITTTEVEAMEAMEAMLAMAAMAATAGLTTTTVEEMVLAMAETAEMLETAAVAGLTTTMGEPKAMEETAAMAAMEEMAVVLPTSLEVQVLAGETVPNLELEDLVLSGAPLIELVVAVVERNLSTAPSHSLEAEIQEQEHLYSVATSKMLQAGVHLSLAQPSNIPTATNLSAQAPLVTPSV